MDVGFKFSGLVGYGNLSQSVKNYTQRYEYINENVTNGAGMSVPDIHSGVDNIINDLLLDNDIACNEREAIYTMLQVYKGSIKMYLSVEQGGLGLLPNLPPSIVSHNQVQTREGTNLGRGQAAGAADVGAIGSYFLGLGVFTALGAVPGTNAVILGGAAFAGAAASGIAAGIWRPCP